MESKYLLWEPIQRVGTAKDRWRYTKNEASTHAYNRIDLRGAYFGTTNDVGAVSSVVERQQDQWFADAYANKHFKLIT